MKRHLLTFTFLIAASNQGFTQNESIRVPKFEDNYCKSIEKLELGNTDIDYKEFRESFLESKQFNLALNQSKELIDLTNEMYDLMPKKEYNKIISVSKKILSIDYTNLRAHKTLHQTYEYISDTLNANKYKKIKIGLLKSIVDTGNGNSCETAWKVIQIAEEYFILEMLDAEVKKQSIVSNGVVCDKMEVIIDNQERTYYFDVEKLLIAKQNLNKK